MTRDNRIAFLREYEWEIDNNTGEASHWKHSPDNWVTIEKALELQDNYDPESVREFRLLNNLNSKQAHMYNEYLDS